MAEQDNAPSQILGKATIPFVADLAEFERGVKEAEKHIDDLADRLKSKLGAAIEAVFTDANERMDRLKERMPEVQIKAPGVDAAPESGGSGQAVVDDTLAKLTEIHTSLVRVEGVTEDILAVLAENE
jgi:hypothetical protein